MTEWNEKTDNSTPLSRMGEKIEALSNNSKATGPSRHVQNTLPNNRRIHILVKCIWDVFQDEQYIQLKIKSQEIKKNRYHAKHFFNHNSTVLDINGRKKTGKFTSS